jgi:hypothetical protein
METLLEFHPDLENSAAIMVAVLWGDMPVLLKKFGILLGAKIGSWFR